MEEHFTITGEEAGVSDTKTSGETRYSKGGRRSHRMVRDRLS